MVASDEKRQDLCDHRHGVTLSCSGEGWRRARQWIAGREHLTYDSSNGNATTFFLHWSNSDWAGVLVVFNSARFARNVVPKTIVILDLKHNGPEA